MAFVLIASLPYAAMFFAGGEAAPPPAAAVETLTIISPHRREVRLEYSRGFGAWMRREHGRGAAIRWLDVGGTSKILKELASRFEAAPDAPGADLMFGGGVDPFYQAAGEGWLAPVRLPAGLLDGVPRRVAGTPVYDPDGRWFGVALSGFGILHNRPLLERMGLPEPASWADLARPEFFSWVASGDPRSSGSVHMCYEIILQAFGFDAGWSLITRICGNVRGFGEGGGTAPREVAAGDVAAGMVIDQYAQTVIDSVGGDALGFVLPEGATVINADPIAMLRGAANPELARLFIVYALSEEGQRLLYGPAGPGGQRHALHRLPVRAALYDAPGAPQSRPYDYEGAFAYDTARGSARWQLVNDLIGVCLIDAHADLSRAWQAVIAAGSPPALVARLCAPPGSEAEMDAAAAQWQDPRFRLSAMNAWARAARARYREVAREAAGEAPGLRRGGGRRGCAPVVPLKPETRNLSPGRTQT